MKKKKVDCEERRVTEAGDGRVIADIQDRRRRAFIDEVESARRGGGGGH